MVYHHSTFNILNFATELVLLLGLECWINDERGQGLACLLFSM